MTGCPRCGGVLPGDPGRVCQCGREWAVQPPVDPEVDWEMVLHLLVVRSGQRCEARTPACLGSTAGKSSPGGYLHELTRQRVNIHHRRPRGMGGTNRPDTNTLANLLLVCGAGNVMGCHGYLEKARTIALARGYLLPKEGPESVPAEQPLVLPGGRRVLLDPVSPVYVAIPDMPVYALDAPDWATAA